MTEDKDQDTIRAILARPGHDPEICELPADMEDQIAAIADLLEGNIGCTEFFDIGNGVTLHILTNDMSIPLGLPPNRRFPGKDRKEILFGNALFVGMYNEASGKDGTVDMPEHVCHMFIEQIKLRFAACDGDEKPDPSAEIYIEDPGTPQERRFRWLEVERPSGAEDGIDVGKARFIRHESDEVLELNGRYFRQVPASEPQ